MTTGISRRHVWLQLLIGWLPIWALFATLIATAHRDTGFDTAALISLRMIAAAALLGIGVQRVAERFPWRTPVTLSFMLLHMAGAAVYSVTWVLLNSLIESVVERSLVLVVGVGIASFLVLGVWLYVMIAGVAYTIQSAERAARAESTATRAQLAALRGQLNPHFLFNALHAVVQLIPSRPKEAGMAAERVAELLRVTIEEDRDAVTLGEELAFVERYLEIERIRFAERLRVHIDVPEPARSAVVPSFALQTLVENAVRHGAGPNIEPTDVGITAALSGQVLEIEVSDNGTGATSAQLQESDGTGLRRLRERLSALYGGAATLRVAAGDTRGVRAVLRIPQEE
jgi:hypothetical protein